MIILPALASAFLAFQGSAPAAESVSLGRTFTKNEFLAYAVRSNLHAEQRTGDLVTWIPEDLDLNYDFTVHVKELKADGIAVMNYKRPTITEVEGQTTEEEPKAKVEKVNYNFLLTVSPFNEILEMKDLNPPKKEKSSSKSDDDVIRFAHTPRQDSLGGLLGGFIGELQRLCLFAGGLDSSLDFAPRMTFDNVKVGDTWKRTVGYQPQKLKGKKNEQAVQRLDYTYTYKGLVPGEKGQVLRIEAKLSFNTDLADFFKQITGASGDEIGLDKAPMKLDATILFDLDPKTKMTLSADATSVGNFGLYQPGKTSAVIEQKIQGHTRLFLQGRKIVVPQPAAPVKTKTTVKKKRPA